MPSGGQPPTLARPAPSSLRCGLRGKPGPTARTRIENPVEVVAPWLKWTHGKRPADCERAVRITLDPLHRETLTNIREFWIALAHKSLFLSDDALATQIETIGRLHAKLDRDARP